MFFTSAYFYFRKMANKSNYKTIQSISELHRMMGLSKPLHPLISLINMDEVKASESERDITFVLNFYGISLKRNVQGKLKYGQGYYDFDEGVLAMTEPYQILSVGRDENYKVSGWWLVFHPDFILNYSLAKEIKSYGFFSYSVNEALHLSDREETQLEAIFKNISLECDSTIDQFSQDVMIAHLELLLTYCNRFYSRQFITRKSVHHDLLSHLDELLEAYFNSDLIRDNGVPSVQYFAERLNVSANYLTDMMRVLTGSTTQQHIHHKMIDMAKLKLTTTNLSVGEVAYHLGFEHPQSFNKFFKSKTNLTPVAFRSSFKN